jgi:hypothetical protein
MHKRGGYRKRTVTKWEITMATKKLQPHSKDDLLTSGAAKDFAYKPAPSNPGNRHVAIPAQAGKPGLLATGVSKTQSARLLGNDQIGVVNDGGKPKSGVTGKNVTDHPATPAKK